MKILITGGSGFIGSHLVEHWETRAHVRVLDALTTGHRRNLDGRRCEFIEGDILDAEAVRAAVAGCDVVFHLAAMVSVAESVGAPSRCAELNGRGLLNVLEASAAAGVKKLVFASSAAVYGDNPTVPKVETMRPEPKSPYAITKLEGEHWCAFWAAERGLPTACLRFFNVFGPRQDPASGYAAAVPIFMARALSGQPLTVHGDGGQTRDFVFVKDIVSALSFAAETEAAQGVYNVGYGGSVTIAELAQTILRLAGSTSPLVHGAERPGDVRHSRASVERLLAAGWVPGYTLEEGLALTLEGYRG